MQMVPFKCYHMFEWDGPVHSDTLPSDVVKDASDFDENLSANVYGVFGMSKSGNVQLERGPCSFVVTTIRRRTHIYFKDCCRL